MFQVAEPKLNPRSKKKINLLQISHFLEVMKQGPMIVSFPRPGPPQGGWIGRIRLKPGCHTVYLGLAIGIRDNHGSRRMVFIWILLRWNLKQNPAKSNKIQKVNGNIMIQNAFPALVEPVYCNETADSQFTVNALSFHEMYCKMLYTSAKFSILCPTRC